MGALRSPGSIVGRVRTGSVLTCQLSAIVTPQGAEEETEDVNVRKVIQVPLSSPLLLFPRVSLLFHPHNRERSDLLFALSLNSPRFI